MPSEESRWSSERGFGFVETLISISVLTAVSIGVAQLFAVAALANHNAEASTSTSVLAVEKMEQLRALTWGFQALAGGELGLPVSDVTTDLSVFPSTSGGPGLLASPGGTLDSNVPYYVDYLDADGTWIGTGGSPASGTVYIRRWAVDRLPTSPNDTVVLQVLATTLKQERQRATAGASGPRGKLPADSWLMTVKTRKGV
ncbi:MAG: hypothetical protein O3A25_03005 [Acidobacteria bacterium]|nr:hypothetical protein [Acidobacteriota bacterium]